MFSFNKPQRKYTHLRREIEKRTDFDTNMDRLGMAFGIISLLALLAIISNFSGAADWIINYFA